MEIFDKKFTIPTGLKHGLDEVIEERDCFQLKDLAVKGTDLIKIGFNQGKELGQTLNELLDLVMAGKLQNNKEELIRYIKDVKKCDRNTRQI